MVGVIERGDMIPIGTEGVVVDFRFTLLLLIFPVLLKLLLEQLAECLAHSSRTFQFAVGVLG